MSEMGAITPPREVELTLRSGVKDDVLRTEMVTLVITIRDGRQFGVQLDGLCSLVADYIGVSRKHGESVRVADEKSLHADIL